MWLYELPLTWLVAHRTDLPPLPSSTALICLGGNVCSPWWKLVILVCLGCYNKNTTDQVAKQQTLISQIWRVGESKIKVLADLVPGEDSLPDLQITTFLVHPHMVEKETSLVSSIRTPVSLMSALPSWPILSQRPQFLIPSHWRLGLQHTNLEGGGHI